MPGEVGYPDLLPSLHIYYTTRFRLDESLLCDMINRVLPKPKADKQLSLLDESIAAVMPNKSSRSKGIQRAVQLPLNTPPSRRSRQNSHHNTTPNCSLDLIDWDDNSQMTEPTHSPLSEPRLLDGAKRLSTPCNEVENDSRLVQCFLQTTALIRGCLV